MVRRVQARPTPWKVVGTKATKDLLREESKSSSRKSTKFSRSKGTRNISVCLFRTCKFTTRKFLTCSTPVQALPCKRAAPAPLRTWIIRRASELDGQKKTNLWSKTCTSLKPTLRKKYSTCTSSVPATEYSLPTIWTRFLRAVIASSASQSSRRIWRTPIRSQHRSCSLLIWRALRSNHWRERPVFKPKKPQILIGHCTCWGKWSQRSQRRKWNVQVRKIPKLYPIVSRSWPHCWSNHLAVIHTLWWSHVWVLLIGSLKKTCPLCNMLRVRVKSAICRRKTSIRNSWSWTIKKGRLQTWRKSCAQRRSTSKTCRNCSLRRTTKFWS